MVPKTNVRIQVTTLATRPVKNSGRNEAQNSLVLLFLKAAQTLSSENALSTRPVTAKCITAMSANILKKTPKTAVAIIARTSRPSEPNSAASSA